MAKGVIVGRPSYFKRLLEKYGPKAKVIDVIKAEMAAK